MYKFKRSLIALIGLVSLVAIATVTTPHLSYGSSGPTASAAPSQPQNVNVVNTPTVNAQQSGNWNVNVANTPSVGFDPSANTVRIDSTNPVTVREKRESYQWGTFFVIPDGASNASVQIAVPGGKRFVIEYINGSVFLPAGQTPEFFVSSGVNAVASNNIFLATHSRPVNVFNEFSLSEPTRIYADGGLVATVMIRRGPATDSAVNASITVAGYLVDLF